MWKSIYKCKAFRTGADIPANLCKVRVLNLKKSNKQELTEQVQAHNSELCFLFYSIYGIFFFLLQ